MSTRTALQEELARLRYDILGMATRVEENLAKAMTALKNQDLNLAKEAKAGDKEVDRLQLAIEDAAAVLIATQQPVARDLRELVTILKVTYNLERAGDYTVHLANTAIKLAGEAPFRQIGRLDRMAGVGLRMIRGAVSAYQDWDVETARSTALLDDEIDHEHKALIEETLSLMKDHPELIKRASKLLTTSGYLERFGDHMTNVCEAVVYMVEGRHLELND